MSIIPYTPGNIPEYRFYLTQNTMTYEVFPLNFLSTSLDDQKGDNQAFYRRKFNGSLTFGTNSLVRDVSGVIQNRRDDWDLIWGFEQIDSCEKLYLTITRTVAGVTDTYWEGYFSTADGKFDIDNCTFEVTPIVEDDYTTLFEGADTQYNILDVATIVSTNAYVFGLYDVDYTRNRWLCKLDSDNVLEFLADKVIPGVTVTSDFFTDSPNNYVTLTTNHLLYLTIAQKSDIIRPASTNPATSAMMSFNELMDILWGLFQVQWQYDALTDTIIVEHVSYFPQNAGLDLRNQLTTVATNKYSYKKEAMPKYEKFSFVEADNEDFVGVPIYYDSYCVNTDPESNTKELAVNVTTDLQYIIDNPDAIADEGFVILCNYLDVTYFVELEGGALSGDVKLNNHLSWANLHNRYYRHNRVLIEGYMNDVLTTFWSAIKTKVQDCSAIVCTDYDPADEITTELGETYFRGAKASVDTSSLKPNNEIKFKLAYGPDENTNTGVADTKFILIAQEGPSDPVPDIFYATLSEECTTDIQINIHAEIYDDTCTLVCTGADEMWTIPSGSRTDTYTFLGVDNPCTAYLAGYSNRIVITIVTAGWDFSFTPAPAINYYDLCP